MLKPMQKPQEKPEKFDLNLVPVINRLNPESYVNGLRDWLGEKYVSGKTDCVTLPWKVLRGVYPEISSHLDESKFYNGGRFLNWLENNNAEFLIVDSGRLSSNVRNGDIILRVKEATNSDLNAFFSKKGEKDYGFWFDESGVAHFIKTYGEAEKMLEGGKTFYLTRHYLTAAENENGATVIHASSAAGKVVEQDIDSEYLKGKTNSSSRYVIVRFSDFAESIGG